MITEIQKVFIARNSMNNLFDAIKIMLKSEMKTKF